MPERFAVLLNLRREQEETCRRELGRRERDRADLSERRTGLLAARDSAAGSVVAPALHEVYGAYWLRLTGEVAALDQRIVEAETAIAAARDALIEARRTVRSIELLQERDRREHARRHERRERRRLDEFAAVQHILREAR